MKVGDVVTLTCGGEHMTVVEVKGDHFMCAFWVPIDAVNLWGIGSGGRKLDTRMFSGDALMLVKTKEPVTP